MQKLLLILCSRMDFILLILAIFNLAGLVSRTGYVNNLGHCVNNVNTSCANTTSVDSGAALCTSQTTTSVFTGPRVLLQYKKTELMNMNSKDLSISKQLLSHLSQLGLRTHKCLCNTRKKYSRGTRASTRRTSSLRHQTISK